MLSSGVVCFIEQLKPLMIKLPKHQAIVQGGGDRNEWQVGIICNCLGYFCGYLCGCMSYIYYINLSMNRMPYTCFG